jgi:hypothetical protein
MKRRNFLAGLAAASAPAAREAGLVGHWPLERDARDVSGSNLHGKAHGVVFSGRDAEFDGRGAVVEVADSAQLALGGDEFTLMARVWIESKLNDVAGSVLAKYDRVNRRGVTLSIKDNCVTTAQSNHRNLHFGIDSGDEGLEWRDEGRPGASVYDMALCVHEGELYAGTCEPEAGQAGHVYRYAGAGRWVDCGSPDRCNAISSLASWEGHLYAGSSKYRLAGSSLPESANTNAGGRIFRLEGDGRWTDCGKLGESEAVACLTVYEGRLYGSSLYAPAGTYRYEGGRQWTFCGTPEGMRVVAMAVYNGSLFGSGYDKGQVYRYLGGEQWAIAGTLPETTQTYGFAVYEGRLYVSTWPSATVFRYERDQEWTPVGRPGDEKESMALAVYNGKMYVGTLPLAQVYRYDNEGRWTQVGQLDRTPNVRYRRAWSMAVWRGRLFCGTLPSGHVYSMEAGRNASYDYALAPGWHHVAAVRGRERLRLYVDGKEVATSAPLGSAAWDVTNRAPLLVGAGDHDFLRGKLRDVRVYRRALGGREIARRWREAQ